MSTFVASIGNGYEEVFVFNRFGSGGLGGLRESAGAGGTEKVCAGGCGKQTLAHRVM